MDDADDKSYRPRPEFVEDKMEPLIDLVLTDSTELWLFQWPINQTPEFNGQQISLKLEGDGHIGSLKSSSGTTYEMFSTKSQGPKETVFLSTESEAKIAGRISKHVSLIHYPEPSELLKRNTLAVSLSQRSSMATSTLSGRRMATPTRSMKTKSSQGHSTPSSRTKSSVSGLGEPSKPAKRKRADSAQSSGKTISGVTSTDSMEQSQERKSKKKKKSEN